MNQKHLQQLAENLWLDYCLIFPALVKFDCPKIVLNNRFTKCAGCCHTETNIVEISGKFYAKFQKQIEWDTLQHELAHQIDFNLNGWFPRKRHHGKDWITIMNKIGVPANAYHAMVL